MITGAQAMVECLKCEGVTTVFGYPGATIAPFYDALFASSIRHILVRQEQNAGHAASGYARISGKPGVCIATSGPGATNLITGIATAYMDSIPLICITGQVRSDQLGRDVFQEADITGATESFIKHSYLIKDVKTLPRVFKEAFHIATTGRPGPVLIDIPMDVQLQELDFVYPEKVDIVGYKPSVTGNVRQIQRAADLIQTAKRPVLCAGGGVFSSEGYRLIETLCEQCRIPVVSTMMGIGVLPSDHPLYLGMIGTHGVKAANRALREADLLILAGARVGDRAMAAPDQIAERAHIVHIDVDPAEIGKNMPAEIPIVGDLSNVRRLLMERLSFQADEAWVQHCVSYKTNTIPSSSREGFLSPKLFLRKLSASMDPDCILVADVGQNQIWCANYFGIQKGRFLTSGGMGTMGYSIPAAIGAKMARPDLQVCAVCGDGSFQMSLNELATINQSGAHVKMVVMRNGRLGMVRELQDKLYGGRHAATKLDGSPDFMLLAEAYGIPALSIREDSQTEEAIETMLSADGPFLLQCIVHPDEPSL